MRIYVASSWRNGHQPRVVELLRAEGHEVYDFRHPEPGNDGFRWEQVDVNWASWDVEAFADALGHPVAEEHFGLDAEAMRMADAGVLVLPSGLSAHLEAGWLQGAHKPVCAYFAGGSRDFKPELMYRLLDEIVFSDRGLAEWAREAARELALLRA